MTHETCIDVWLLDGGVLAVVYSEKMERELRSALHFSDEVTLSLPLVDGTTAYVRPSYVGGFSVSTAESRRAHRQFKQDRQDEAEQEEMFR